MSWFSQYMTKTHFVLTSQSNIDIGGESESSPEDRPGLSKQEERKEYNLGVLKQVQAIFGHLAESKLQYYVPRGFWKHFK